MIDELAAKAALSLSPTAFTAKTTKRITPAIEYFIGVHMALRVSNERSQQRDLRRLPSATNTERSRKAAELRKALLPQIIELRAQGLTMRSVGKEIGKSESFVSRALKSAEG